MPGHHPPSFGDDVGERRVADVEVPQRRAGGRAARSPRWVTSHVTSSSVFERSNLAGRCSRSTTSTLPSRRTITDHGGSAYSTTVVSPPVRVEHRRRAFDVMAVAAVAVSYGHERPVVHRLGRHVRHRRRVCSPTSSSIDRVADRLDEIVEVVELAQRSTPTGRSLMSERFERPHRSVGPQRPRRSHDAVRRRRWPVRPWRRSTGRQPAVTSAACAVATTTTAGSHISPPVCTGAQRERRSGRCRRACRSAWPPARSPRRPWARPGRAGDRGTPPRSIPTPTRWATSANSELASPMARARTTSSAVSGSASTAKQSGGFDVDEDVPVLVVDAELGQGDARRAHRPGARRRGPRPARSPGIVQRCSAPRHGSASDARPLRWISTVPSGAQRTTTIRCSPSASWAAAARRAMSTRSSRSPESRRRSIRSVADHVRVRERDARRRLGRPQPGAPTRRQQGDDAGGDQRRLTDPDR